jgi:RNA polymerase sigma factor (sigma-70 family)
VPRFLRLPAKRLPNAIDADAADSELVSAAQAGDKAAFVKIVHRYQTMVCGIALGMLGDLAASEDAGQDAFLQAWRNIRSLREPEKLRGWLAQIARNSAKGQLRSRKEVEPFDPETELVDSNPTPDAATASAEEAELVRKSLADLPENYRTVLVLYYREGQSVRAVADTLGISEDAVKQRLVRGRDMCRDRMLATLEGVLSRTKPSSVFTASMAIAIGAIAVPSAFASGVLGAGAGAGSTAASTASSSTLVGTLMTTSKGFLAAVALTGVACITVGYRFERPTTPPTPAIVTHPQASATAEAKVSFDFSDSSLVAQWEALHAKYGTNAEAMPLLYNAIKEETNSFRRLALSSALVSEWGMVDPAAGLKFLVAKSAAGDERLQLFREWLPRHPQAAVTTLLAAGKGWQSVARQCLVEIAQAVPALIPSVVTGLPAPDGFWDHDVRDAFAVMAEKDPLGARQAAEALSGPNRDAALGGVAKQWAQADLDAAVAWAKSLPDGTDRDEIIRNALLGRAAISPTEALDSLGIVPSGGRTDYFASSTAARVLSVAAEADFDATINWLTSHPGRLSRQDLLGMAEAVTTRLNADAPGFLSAQAAAGNLDVLNEAIGSALLNSAGGQLPAVWDWLKNQPSSPATEQLRKSVMHTSGYDDPKFAMQLAAELPDSESGKADTRELARALFNGGNMLGRFDSVYATAPERLRQPLVEAAFSFLSKDNFSDPQAWVARLRLLPADQLPTTAGKLAEAWGSLPGPILSTAPMPKMQPQPRSRPAGHPRTPRAQPTGCSPCPRETNVTKAPKRSYSPRRNNTRSTRGTGLCRLSIPHRGKALLRACSMCSGNAIPPPPPNCSTPLPWRAMKKQSSKRTSRKERNDPASTNKPSPSRPRLSDSPRGFGWLWFGFNLETRLAPLSCVPLWHLRFIRRSALAFSRTAKACRPFHPGQPTSATVENRVTRH